MQESNAQAVETLLSTEAPVVEPRKILITGGNGFIGSAVAKQLEEKGHEVSFFDLRDGNDVMDAQQVDAAIQKVDQVIHLAGILGTDKTMTDDELARKAIEVNMLGGLNVIQACTKHGKKLVTLDNGNWWMANPYSASKFAINRIVDGYTKNRGLHADIVRVFNVYGPGQSTKQNKFAPNFIMAALRGEPLVVYGNGYQQMDPIFVEDAAEGIVDVALNGLGEGDITEVGTGKGWQVQDFARLVCEVVGVPELIKFVPMRAGEEKFSLVVAKQPHGDKTKLQSEERLREKLALTVDYYREVLKQESK